MDGNQTGESMKKRWFLCETGILFAADQILKSYTEQNMDKGEERELTEHLALRRVSNKGLCLNLLDNSPRIVKGLSLAAAATVSLFYVAALLREKGFWKKKSLSLMAAGAWSNTFDRFARGHVVDYIGFKCKNEKMSSITYNLADFFIAIGAALLTAVSLGITEGKEKKS